MQKVKVYRCPRCKYTSKTLNAWCKHMEEKHPDACPPEMSLTQYFYFLLTGKDGAKCVVCHRPTKWNEVSLKYNRMCGREECKKASAKKAKENVKRVYGKEHLLNDPEMQKKMLKGRKISGVYQYQDGGEIDYVGSYEKDFHYMLDHLFHWNSTDIESPSPHVYRYQYEGSEHFYIPDIYIGSLNLEIEIKQTTNKHPKILRVDKEKERLKDEVMIKRKDVNYLKINDMNYLGFMEYLDNLTSTIDENKKTKKDIAYDTMKESPATEATLSTKERNELEDASFGIPSLRKYPLHDKAHVKAAIRFFHQCESKYEKQLAKNILKKMVEFKIPIETVSEKNPLYKYIAEIKQGRK